MILLGGPSSVRLGFPGGSDGKESDCNAGNLGLIPGSGRFPREGMATHSSILAWKIHGQRSLADYSPWGRKESDMTEQLTYFTLSVTKEKYVLILKTMRSC